MIIDQINFRGIKLFIIRDDLYPLLGGGNKGRKIAHIAEEIVSKLCNAIVTTGGIQSNHCRAVALKCAEKGWPCKLILHGSEERFFSEGGNAKIIRMTGAEVEFVEASNIGPSMDRAMTDFREQGYEPYYLYGGGHNLKGGEAYILAVDELLHYCITSGNMPDHVFLASGTGSTQAGIMAGLEKNQLNTQVNGISIARSKANAKKIIQDFYDSLRSEYQILGRPLDVKVYDEYLHGGYECYTNELVEFTYELSSTSGILIDPTYTGKAFYGMIDVIKKEKLSGNIFFWHTGGINNLLAANLI